WTLYIELCFYIFMLFLFRNKLLKHIQTIAIGWLVVALFFSIKTYAARWGWFTESIYLDNSQLQTNFSLVHQAANQVGFLKYLKHTLKDILILQYAHLFVLGIMLYKQYKEGFTLDKLILIIICVFAQRFAYSHEQSWETTIFVAGFTLLFFLSIQGYIRWIRLKPLIFLGTISYSLYLIHQNIGYVIIKMLYGYNIHPNISIIIAIILSMIMAIAMTFIIERPALKLIKSKYNQIMKC
ncbi:MAG: acyltransferase family protein, partial [Cyanobacteria bacterium J06639_18]